MKYLFRLFSVVLCIVTVATSLVACNGTPKIEYTKYEQSTVQFNANSDVNDDSYNTQLYYRNDLNQDMGDPMMIYDNGVFYAYGTRGVTNFQVITSTDLTNWTASQVCFTPQPGSWGTTDLWAPDIQKIGDKWYLYYTAKYVDPETREENCQMGVAIGDSPMGPFVQYTGINENGETITLADPAFAWKGHTILDSHVFQDDDGQLYMYFSYDTNTAKKSHEEDPLENPDTGTSEIYGVKMKDPVTWDFSTLTRLISAGYKNLDETTRSIDWETWSPSFAGRMECVEGPYMIKRDGKYFLTYTANSYVDTEYAVGYAVSDAPLGKYDKPNDTYLENMLLGVPGQTGTYINTRYLGFTTGTGHASICKVGEQYMFAYHAHYNRHKWGELEDLYPGKTEWRALGYDYLLFDDNGNPYTNGPTYSLVNLPEVVSGYTNLATKATIRAEGKDAQYLNDQYTNRAFNTDEICKETQFEAGTRSIEIVFDSPVYVKAVNVYNSYDYSKKTDFISQIDFGEGRGIVNVLFNQRYLNFDTKWIYPHSAYNIELEEMLYTDRIVITFESDKDFALGEIEIIGKEKI